MVALNFNRESVAPNVALEPVPSGQYTVAITNSVEKPTKNGLGAYLELEMTIQGGEFNGRKIFDRLNIRNPNEQTMEIAYRTLSSILYVTGVPAMQDTQQLHGRPFIAVVVKVPRDDRPDLMTNNIRGYKDVNGNDPGQQGNGGGNTGGAPAWQQNGQQQQQVQQQTQQTQQVQQQSQPDPNAQQGGQAASTEKPPWAK